MKDLNATYFLAYSTDEHFVEPLKAEAKNLGFQNCILSEEWNECMHFIRNSFPAIFICDIDGLLERENTLNLQQLRSIIETTPTIVVSSYPEYQNEQFSLADLEPFINKPSLKKNLVGAVNIALTFSRRFREENKIHMLPPPIEKIFFKIGNSLKSYKVNEINYFYSERKMNYARFDNRALPTMTQLKCLESKFYNNFVRIHRGYLVNLGKIDEIDFSDNVVVVNGKGLPLGEKFRGNLLARIEMLK